VRPRASRQRPLLNFRSVALTLVGFLVAGAFGAGTYFAPVVAAAFSFSGSVAPHTPTPGASTGAVPAAGNLRPFTVLLLGSDDDEKFDPGRTGAAKANLLTQSMILVRVDPASKAVTMFSIARDLWVPITKTGGSNKIMTAFAYGGASNAIQTVETNFQVQIDYYVWIGLTGLIKLIDYVGGIDVVTSNPVMDDYYPNDINSSDPYGTKRVAVLPGPQHLDGVHALEYVRSRHSDLIGDFGRSARQQQVLLALRAKAKSLGIADLPDIASVFQNELKTNMDLQTLRELLPIASQIQPQSVKQLTMYGGMTYSQTINGEDAQVPNWGQIRPVVRQYFP
jgi:LCP family protein required for cell wall assembly